MRRRSRSKFFIACFICNLLIIHNSWAQRVKENFSHLIFTDDFTEDKGLWDIKSDAGSLFLIQSDEYLLKRRDKESEMAALCRWLIPCPSWELRTTFRLEKDADGKGSAGLLFMMQNDRSGGFVFEINTKKQYRIRQVVSGNYRLLTGRMQNQGWTNSPSIGEAGKYNLMRVAYSEKNYDVYLNETLVLSFSEVNYQYGGFGFVAGPSSTAYVDFVRISATDACANPAGRPVETQAADSSGVKK